MTKFLTLSVLVSAMIAANTMADDRETFMADFKLQDGSHKTLGFRVMKIKKGSIYEKIGLRDGDIIKKFNSKPIRNSMEAKSIFHQIKTMKRVDLLVKRNGQEVPLHYRN